MFGIKRRPLWSRRTEKPVVYDGFEEFFGSLDAFTEPEPNPTQVAIDLDAIRQRANEARAREGR